MGEKKFEVDPNTYMTRDEAWVAAHEWAEAQRPQVTSPQLRKGGAPLTQQKKK